MKKIYAVNSGCYSDRCIVAIFTSMKLANEFMAAVPNGVSDYNEVEVFDLNPKTADLIKRGYSIFSILMLRNGDTELVRRLETDVYNIDMQRSIWRRSGAPAYRDKGVPDCLQATVWARTEKHAIKIVNEYRTQMIANGEWE